MYDAIGNQLFTPEKPLILCCNWKLSSISNPSGSGLWFSDGQSLYDIRGADGLSSRLIIGSQGFLDFTSFNSPTVLGVDLNGATIFAERINEGWTPKLSGLTLTIDLKVENGQFTATVQALSNKDETSCSNFCNFLGSLHTNQGDWRPSDLVTLQSGGTAVTVNGLLKPLPQISDEDVQYMNTLIAQKYIPYQNVPGDGKSDEEIRNLGKRLFPFTDHNYHLALSIYDWTTASFARMVFMKVFQYTSMSGSPICKGDIANMIWGSNWNTYNPSDKYYMMSFMMHPASSLDEVKHQLDNVSDELRKLSDMENRLLASAMAAMPRTSYISKPQLYSGQPDVYQFGLDRFGVEFLECPVNGGPIADSMTWNFQHALDTFMAAGRVITTKTVWSFTDSYQEALHYSSGIILVLSGTTHMSGTPSPFNQRSFVWDAASYITELSEQSDRIEYTFPIGSQFRVINWFRNNIGRIVINLQVHDPSTCEATGTKVEGNTAPVLPWTRNMPVAVSETQEALYDDSREHTAREKANEMKGVVEPDLVFHASLIHNNRGRWCRCVQAVLEVLA